MEQNYPQDMVDKVLTSFAKNGTVRDIGVPDDIQDKVQESLADKHLNRIKELLK